MSQGNPPLQVKISLKEAAPEFILSGFLDLYSNVYNRLLNLSPDGCHHSIGSCPALHPSSDDIYQSLSFISNKHPPNGIQLPLFLRYEGRRSLETFGKFVRLHLLNRPNGPLGLDVSLSLNDPLGIAGCLGFELSRQAVGLSTRKTVSREKIQKKKKKRKAARMTGCTY